MLPTLAKQHNFSITFGRLCFLFFCCVFFFFKIQRVLFQKTEMFSSMIFMYSFQNFGLDYFDLYNEQKYHCGLDSYNWPNVHKALNHRDD